MLGNVNFSFFLFWWRRSLFADGLLLGVPRSTSNPTISPFIDACNDRGDFFWLSRICARLAFFVLGEDGVEDLLLPLVARILGLLCPNEMVDADWCNRSSVTPLRRDRLLGDLGGKPMDDVVDFNLGPDKNLTVDDCLSIIGSPLSLPMLNME
jgi:hypothetical protein